MSNLTGGEFEKSLKTDEENGYEEGCEWGRV